MRYDVLLNKYKQLRDSVNSDIINRITPSHLTDPITMAAESHNRNTRLTDTMDVFLPAPKTGAGMKTFS
jgi:hypothetical protein